MASLSAISDSATFVRPDRLAQVLDELAAAVGFHLTVGELVHAGRMSSRSMSMHCRVSSALQLSPSEKWNG